MSKSIGLEKNLEILIIDDNEQITKMISTFLKLNNHQCTVANDGTYGLDLLNNKNFDVILLDLAMPELDGYEILEKIKDQEILSKIIVLTASNITKENQKIFEKIGTKLVLQKPVDIDTLLEKIKEISNS